MIKKLDSTFEYDISDLNKYIVRCFSLLPGITIKIRGWTVSEGILDVVYLSEKGTAVKKIIKECIKIGFYRVKKGDADYTIHCLYTSEEVILILH